MWKSGALIQVVCDSPKTSIRFLIENKRKNCYSLADPARPYERLCVCQNGSVEFSSSSDRLSLLTFLRSDEEEVSCGSSMFWVKGCVSGLYLTSSTSTLGIMGLPFIAGDKSCASLFEIRVVESAAVLLLNEPHFDPTPPFRFAPWQLRRFYNEGFLHVPQLCHASKVDNCMRLLTHLLGVPGSIIPGGVQLNTGKFTGGITQRAEVRALVDGPVGSAVAALLGGKDFDDVVDLATLNTQIAFRFPQLEEPSPVDCTG